MSLVLRDGLYWPAHDRECHRVAMQVTDTSVATNRCMDRSIAVQAGGNVGVWPLFLAERFDRVFTFEPEVENYTCLCLNTADTDRIEVVHGALSDVSGRAAVSFVRGNSGAHQIVEGDAFPTHRIDDMALPSCGLIQLDVEGYEGPALAGAAETVARFHPVIMVELKGLGGRYGWPDERVKGLLAEWGYRCIREVHRDWVYVHAQ